MPRPAKISGNYPYPIISHQTLPIPNPIPPLPFQVLACALALAQSAPASAHRIVKRQSPNNFNPLTQHLWTYQFRNVVPTFSRSVVHLIQRANRNRPNATPVQLPRKRVV